VGVNAITVNISGSIVNTASRGTPGTASATSTVTTTPTMTTTGGGLAVWNLATTGGNNIRVVRACYELQQNCGAAL
jgi:hypothetical protein